MKLAEPDLAVFIRTTIDNKDELVIPYSRLRILPLSAILAMEIKLQEALPP